MGVLGIELYQLPILRYSVHVCECACYVRSNFSNGRGEYHRFRVIYKISARRRGSQFLCNIGAIYGDKLQSRATIEGKRADARDTFGNRDSLESRAIIEGIHADARHAIRDRDSRESRAMIEGIIADARDIRRDDAVFAPPN